MTARSAADRKLLLTRGAVLALTAGLWLSPVPEGIVREAWHLFALFAAAIVSVVIGAFPILTASVLALAAAVLSGTLAPAKAYAGFANATILLIVVAFLVARAVVKCGLGERLGHMVVSVFGRSTLGLGYSIFVVDGVIAPAFPSNTARSGVLYPLVLSLAEAAGARPGVEGRERVGRFLMFSGIASLTLSSALWFTAMAGNPLGAEIARGYGLEIGFGSWFVASSVPTLVAMALLPLVLYKVIAPEVTATPEAPRAARRALAELGPLRAHEKVVAATFAVMVALWASASTRRARLDRRRVSRPRRPARDRRPHARRHREGRRRARDLHLVRGALHAQRAAQRARLHGLPGRAAGRRARAGCRRPLAGVLLVVVYVLLHYLFVSQTAHLLALFGVFLDVGVKLGVPVALLAFLLLFATNFFSAITPQAASANLLFAGSGYLSQGELYRLGGLTTAFNLVIYLVVGIPWLILVTR